MKAAQYSEYGGTEVLQVNEIEPPILKDGQVLVEIKATAINPFDIKLRSGDLKDSIPLTFPVTIAGDFSGVLSQAIGDFDQGAEVYGSALILNGGSGAAADQAAVNLVSLAVKPDALSFSQAAALVLVGVSAIQALDKLNLIEGQKIFIHGGAGGIGSVAIQYAKYLGLYIATTIRETDKGFVTELGADETIDYEHQQFEDVIGGYDAVYDTVGGETYDRSFKVLKNGGMIISMIQQPNQELMEKFGVMALHQSTEVNSASLNRLRDVVDAGAIKPQVDREFALDEVKEAYGYLETGHPKGKVVIKIA